MSMHAVNAKVNMYSFVREYATADYQINDTVLDAEDGVQCQLCDTVCLQQQAAVQAVCEGTGADYKADLESATSAIVA